MTVQLTSATYTALQTHYANFQQWAIDRNFHTGATIEGQALKMLEELGEFVGNYKRSKPVLDDLGDMLVVVNVIRCMLQQEAHKHPSVAMPPNGGDGNVAALIAATSSAISYILIFAYRNVEQWAVGRISSELHRIELSVLALCAALDVNPAAACAHAWNEIKDRRGRMENGVFIKEADLRARNKARLREGCSTLCENGQPCMASSDGRCACEGIDALTQEAESLGMYGESNG